MEDRKKIFPFWLQLEEAERNLIENSLRMEKYNKGMLMHRTENSCKGLMAVLAGQLRTYIVSDEGREVTLFRVQCEEVCILSASCLMDSVTFDVLIEATEDTEVMIIPAAVLNQVMKQNPYVELYMYKSATEKFSDVMWTIQQILFMKIDQRVAQFLWDEMLYKDSMTLHITQDEIAKYIGSAREVVTKVMKYLSQENVIQRTRGTIKIVSKEKLHKFL